MVPRGRGDRLASSQRRFAAWNPTATGLPVGSISRSAPTAAVISAASRPLRRSDQMIAGASGRPPVCPVGHGRRLPRPADLPLSPLPSFPSDRACPTCSPELGGLGGPSAAPYNASG